MEENNYYPFGLKHENYNAQKLKLERSDDGVSIVLRPTVRNIYQYKYQGQERQDELGLNWDSFKWRNYDHAIGRFMSIDPLAADYPYNSTYAFQENKMGLGRELEGLELIRTQTDRNIDNAGLRPVVNGIQSLYTSVVSFFREQTSNKDLSTTVTSQKGGNDNPKTTGKTGGNIEVDAFIDNAPGSPKSGNKYGKIKDILSYAKDVIAAEKKGEKAAGGVETVVKENGKTPASDVMKATNSNGVEVITPLSNTEAERETDSLNATKEKIGGLPTVKVEIIRR